MKKKSIQIALLTTLGVVGVAVPVYAENNPIIDSHTNAPYEYLNASTYWTTSNLREWLNSDTKEVTYTNDAPTKSIIGNNAYADEAGFLNGFSKEEVDAIGVTKRRAFVPGSLGATARDGGSRDIPRYDGVVHSPFYNVSSINLETVWKTIYYQTVNDKVYTLTPMELYEYVQKRGISYQKKITETAKKKHNISSEFYQYSTSTYNYSNTNSNSLWAIGNTGKTDTTTPTTATGIAPALHLKPDYVLSNGKKAKTLAIGEKVIFGQYENSPIEWMVINVTPEGYPLLWSDKVISLKQYDAKGEKLYRNSVSVNFPQADISIENDLKFTNNQTDTTAPSIKVQDAEQLLSRQNEAYKLTIVATDKESGIDYIITPDGTKVYKDTVDFNVTKNGRYYFTAVDKAGNQYGFEVPVGNLNPNANVLFTTSADGWTNKNVTVDISTTEANTTYSVDSVNTSKSFPTFSEYTSYSGKRFRITGEVRLISAIDEKQNAVIRMIYDQINVAGTNYYVGKNYPSAVSIPLKTLSQDTFTKFDTIYTIPNGYFGLLYPALAVDTSSISSGKYKVEWKDVTIDLLDKQDFAIGKIILPTGQEVVANSYTDTLTSEGTYTYQILDSRGKTTTETVTVLIDKVLPTIAFIGNPVDYTSNDVEIKVKASDDRSGVKRILKPNQEWESTDTLTYRVNQNGTYSFKVEDNAGNVTTKSITVNKIDKTIPELTATLSQTKWTNQNVKINLTASDEEGKVSFIQMPNGNRVASSSAIYEVSQNGIYEFLVEDTVGHQSVKKVTVTNIDKAPSTAIHSIEPTDGNKQKFTIKASDANSGIKQIHLPNGEVVSSNLATFIGEKETAYTFRLEDNAGNITNYTIEKGVPSLSVYPFNEHTKAEWNMTNVIKSQLVRGNDLLYEGKLTEYEDTLATDKTSPDVVQKLSMAVDNKQVFMNIEQPLDNGTSYEYRVIGETPKGDTLSSEKKKVTVTSHIKGYSYLIDKNPNTEPDNVIDSTSEKIKMPELTNEKYFIHIKSLDNAGNRSSVAHIPFQDNTVPLVELSVNTKEWVGTNVIISASSTDNIGIKRMKNPMGEWVDGSSLTYPVYQNGEYSFTAEDYAGNQTTKSIVVSNIDKTPPSSPTFPHSEEWRNDRITVSIKEGVDAQTSILRTEYELVGATNKAWSTYTSPFEIVNEGVTKITARTIDKYNNVSENRISYVRIDKSSPTNVGIELKLKP